IERGQRAHGPAAQGAVVSPLQGTVLRVAVAPGQTVVAGDLICVIEAMKMENEIHSTAAGEVVRVDVEPGQTVQIGAPLVEIEPEG
ncbi:MAG TPA: biotin/lipoyl-containing protein, partial [Nitrolancea sp.]|nr:biotin/lipoyl-containing protein [Nitrolancea sp.]